MQGSENSLQGAKVAQTRPMLSVVNEKLNATAKQLADIKHETDEIQEQLRKVEQKVDSRKRTAAPQMISDLHSVKRWKSAKNLHFLPHLPTAPYELGSES